MQRPATKQSPAANAEEKKFHTFVKHEPCSFCGNPAGSIVDHCKGSSFKHNKILIGHWFVNSKCLLCDTLATKGMREELFNLYDINDADATLLQMAKYESEADAEIPEEVKVAINDLFTDKGEDTTNEWMDKL